MVKSPVLGEPHRVLLGYTLREVVPENKDKVKEGTRKGGALVLYKFIKLSVPFWGCLRLLQIYFLVVLPSLPVGRASRLILRLGDGGVCSLFKLVSWIGLLWLWYAVSYWFLTQQRYRLCLYKQTSFRGQYPKK